MRTSIRSLWVALLPGHHFQVYHPGQSLNPDRTVLNLSLLSLRYLQMLRRYLQWPPLNATLPPPPQRDMREDASPASGPHLHPTTGPRGGANNTPTILTTATSTTPITREAGRLDTLNTARRMLGRRQEPSFVMPVPTPRTTVVCTQTTSDR